MGHIGNHRDLLCVPEQAVVTGSKVDAIIVPSARTAPYLRMAGGLAEELCCPLLVLCSKHAQPKAIIQDLEEHLIVADVIAIDITPRARQTLPEFGTTRLLAGTLFERSNDVSFKRNLGLSIARMAGWQRVVFLDDDMKVPDSADLRRAVGLLDEHDGVGLNIGGYPDNSVVCHAFRESGGAQETFVGGGALAVSADPITSFFPDIYNEDWFFFLDESGLQRVALIGEALQQPYDPFANPERARGEEFGDDLAEGILALLHNGGKLRDADEAYWARFLRARAALIDDVISRGSTITDVKQREAMLTCLRAARGRLSVITPELCAGYLEAWRADRMRWLEFVGGLPYGLSVDEAVRRLGLGRQCTARWNRTGPCPKEPRLRIHRKRLDRAGAAPAAGSALSRRQPSAE